MAHKMKMKRNTETMLRGSLPQKEHRKQQNHKPFLVLRRPQRHSQATGKRPYYLTCREQTKMKQQ